MKVAKVVKAAPEVSKVVEAPKVEVVAPKEEVLEELSEEEYEEEDKVEVKKFEFKGIKYLRSTTNILYDATTQDAIGHWNEDKQEVEELEEELEEEEEEEEEEEDA